MPKIPKATSKKYKHVYSPAKLITKINGKIARREEKLDKKESQYKYNLSSIAIIIAILQNRIIQQNSLQEININLSEVEIIKEKELLKRENIQHSLQKIFTMFSNVDIIKVKKLLNKKDLQLLFILKELRKETVNLIEKIEDLTAKIELAEYQLKQAETSLLESYYFKSR